ncbi:M56 family metallopeptidase [Cohnella phaseoli]|uniref:Beta-lactamase regulating signal transducer with metallopeptidase domain n=1 Tax=Cohnella phaseoli TaxID=456490 RepID=A0A3D9IBX3_9BACL|nr:M56 family metallopeptidase [Cohnella phaseoli]RED59155.1 beta-lactamase regulating signal transducer with metallopeptidase domain [Cohnella phaseoli]
MSLIEMSLSASLFILVVVCFRPLLLHRIPKMTFILLWGVALLRLLVPVSFHSPFSIFTAVNDLGRMFTLQGNIPSTPSSPVTNGETVTLPFITERMVTPNGPLEPSATLSPFMPVWLVGFTLCALSIIIPHLRCRKHYRSSLPIKSDFVQKWQQSNPLWRKVQVRQSDLILAPLTYGVFRPVILLPKHIDYTDTEQLRFILAHEYTHIHRFDTLKKWLLAASLCIHWFNPFVWVMYILANRDIELSCDEKVIRTFGESTKPAYARTLVHMEVKKSGLSSMVSYFSKSPIEERIISIMKIKKVSIATMLLAIAIVTGTVTVFATSALDKKEVASDDKPVAEEAPALYQGESSTALMPIDLTFNRSDVPQLMDQLHASKYRAVYVDNEMVLRITNDNSIQIRKNNGAGWKKYDTDRVDAKDFANWLFKNDPIPGYSMKELQSRLANGAEVKHIAFENGKEMYVIIDSSGVQIELVQPQKIAAVLIDGQRMMITSERHPYVISEQMLKSFYDLLISSDILTKNQAEQDYSKRIQFLKEDDTIFTVTN